MNKIKRPYTIEQLCYDYLSNKISTSQIAAKYNIAEHLVSKDLAKLKIGRNQKEAAEVAGITKKINKEDLYQFYIIENHTTDETAKYFGVHERTIRRRLNKFNIIKSLELQLKASKRVQEERYGGYYVQSSYFTDQNIKDMVGKVKQTCLEKYGVEWISSLDSTKEKAIQTRLQKYGVPYYTQTEEYHTKTRRFYTYDNEMFDSSWELALWIYAKEHDEEIKRCPCSFEYFVDGKIHKYFPDFLYKGALIEIKGDFYVNDQEELVEYNSQTVTQLSKAKTSCMKEHQVQVFYQRDIQFALDYVFKKYGRSYLKSFQIRKK